MARTDRRLDQDEGSRGIRLRTAPLPGNTGRSPAPWDAFPRARGAGWEPSNLGEIQFTRGQLGLNRRVRLQMQLHPEFHRAPEGIDLGVALSETLACAEAYRQHAKANGGSTLRSQKLVSALQELM